MRKIGSIKKKQQILDATETPIVLTNIPIYIEIMQGEKVVKKYRTETYVADTEGEILTILPDNVSFYLILTGEELDSMTHGHYSINIWWFENDTDFPNDTRRKFAKVDETILIP